VLPVVNVRAKNRTLVTHLGEGGLGDGVIFSAEYELDAVTFLRLYLIGSKDGLIDMSQGRLVSKTGHTASWPEASNPTLTSKTAPKLKEARPRRDTSVCSILKDCLI
jgi:hypothetical protein